MVQVGNLTFSGDKGSQIQDLSRFQSQVKDILGNLVSPVSKIESKKNEVGPCIKISVCMWVYVCECVCVLECLHSIYSIYKVIGLPSSTPKKVYLWTIAKRKLIKEWEGIAVAQMWGGDVFERTRKIGQKEPAELYFAWVGADMFSLV